MYCPNCGAQNKKKQNFCRYCGLHLQDIEKTFSDQLVFGVETKRLKNLRTVRKLTENAQFFSFVTLVIGVISLLIFDSNMGKVLLTAGLLSFFLAQSIREIFGYFQRRNAERGNKQRVSNDAKPYEFEAKETSKLIDERSFTPVMSVTENSTELLFVERKRNELK